MGEKIKLLRQHYQMTQDQVAEKLNCNREKVSRYENDLVRYPDYFFICSLAELFHVSSDYFKPQEGTNNEKRLTS